MNQKRINTILVVDDESSITDLIHAILTDQGNKVYTARDGKEGLKIFESTKPDLVITDIIMPEIEGIEFMRKLLTKRKDLPIIVMSGHEVGINFFKTVRKIGRAHV